MQRASEPDGLSEHSKFQFFPMGGGGGGGMSPDPLRLCPYYAQRAVLPFPPPPPKKNYVSWRPPGYSLPLIIGVHEDDITLTPSQCAELPILAQETVLTEKLDGGNCCIYQGKVS